MYKEEKNFKKSCQNTCKQKLYCTLLNKTFMKTSQLCPEWGKSFKLWQAFACCWLVETDSSLEILKYRMSKSVSIWVNLELHKMPKTWERKEGDKPGWEHIHLHIPDYASIIPFSLILWSWLGTWVKVKSLNWMETGELA